MFDARAQINAETMENFYSEEDSIRRSVTRLQDAGFEVLQVTQSQINFRGTREQYHTAFATNLYSEERPVIKEFGVEDTAEFFDAGNRTAGVRRRARPSTTCWRAWRLKSRGITWRPPCSTAQGLLAPGCAGGRIVSVQRRQGPSRVTRVET